MTETKKIGVLGGDLRQKYAVLRLCERYECAVWGFVCDDCRAVKCTDWQSAVRGADGVVLPLPVTRDGIRLNGLGDTPTLSEICLSLKPGAILCGGMLPQSMREAANERRAVTYDYYDAEEVQIKNALPTAEGAIAALMSEMPMTVAGMRIAVTGYGRVARTLALRLLSLGAAVSVTARGEKDLAWATVDGCATVRLEDFVRCPVACDALVNTVPVRLFGEETLASLDGNTVLFELAPGGMDATAAEKTGHKLVSLPSLPGKTSPETAGYILGDAILKKLDAFFGEAGV